MAELRGKSEEVQRFVDGQITCLVRAGFSVDNARIKIGLYCGADRLVSNALDFSREWHKEPDSALRRIR